MNSLLQYYNSEYYDVFCYDKYISRHTFQFIHTFILQLLCMSFVII